MTQAKLQVKDIRNGYGMNTTVVLSHYSNPSNATWKGDECTNRPTQRFRN